MADHDGLGDVQRVQRADDVLCDAGDRDRVVGVWGAGSAVCINGDAAVLFGEMGDDGEVVVLRRAQAVDEDEG